MDCVERREFLSQLGRMLDDERIPLRALAIEKELMDHFDRPQPNTEEQLALIAASARQAGLPCTGAHYSDDGLAVVLEMELRGFIQTVRVK